MASAIYFCPRNARLLRLGRNCNTRVFSVMAKGRYLLTSQVWRSPPKRGLPSSPSGNFLSRYSTINAMQEPPFMNKSVKLLLLLSSLSVSGIARAEDHSICVQNSQACIDSCDDRDFSCPQNCANEGYQCVRDVNSGKSPSPKTYKGGISTSQSPPPSSPPTTSSQSQPRKTTPSQQTPAVQPLNRRIDKPMSNTGQACISVSSGPVEQDSTLREHAAQCNSAGHCTDNVFVFNVTNVCSAPMSFKWNFSGSRSGDSLRTLAPGSSTKVTCHQVRDSCTGDLNYTWFTQ
jgi:hypothetical protein